MGRKRVELPMTEILNEYLTSRVSIVTLAQRYKVSQGTINTRLKELGVKCNVRIIQPK